MTTDAGPAAERRVAAVPHARQTGRARLSVVGPWFVAVVLFLTLLATTLLVIGTANAGSVDLPTLSFFMIVGLWGLVQASVGTLIASRRAENRMGRLLQASGTLVIAVFLGFFLAALRNIAVGPGDAVAGIAGWWATTTIFLAIYLAFPLVGILYPDGRLPGPRWRLPTQILTLLQVAVAGLYAVATGPLGADLPDNPFGLIDFPADMRNAAGLIGLIGLIVAMALAVVAITVRWRRGNRLERSQLKWLLAALVVAGLLFPLAFNGSSADSPNLLTNLTFGSILLIPIAIGIAILRYRLYEIDRLISRTVSWAVITGLLVVVFAAAVVALQSALAGFTQGQTLAVAASTLAAFALFQPLRHRVQSAVDRRFDRTRYDGQRTADAFAERLRNVVDVATLRAALVETVDQSVHPLGSAVWLRTSATGR